MRAEKRGGSGIRCQAHPDPHKTANLKQNMRVDT